MGISLPHINFDLPQEPRPETLFSVFFIVFAQTAKKGADGKSCCLSHISTESNSNTETLFQTERWCVQYVLQSSCLTAVHPHRNIELRRPFTAQRGDNMCIHVLHPTSWLRHHKCFDSEPAGSGHCDMQHHESDDISTCLSHLLQIWSQSPRQMREESSGFALTFLPCPPLDLLSAARKGGCCVIRRSGRVCVGKRAAGGAAAPLSAACQCVSMWMV